MPNKAYTPEEIARIRKTGARGNFQGGRRYLNTAARRITSGDTSPDPTGKDRLTEAELLDVQYGEPLFKTMFGKRKSAKQGK